MGAIGLVLISACGGGGGGSSNRAPALGAAAFSTNEDTDVSGQLNATDPEGDAVTFSRTTDPASGTVTSFSDSGAFAYHPNANVSGSDSFNVRLTDAHGSTATGTVTITITPVNDAPLANNDVMRADGSQLASIDVRKNDVDPESDALTVTIEEQAAVGTASVNSDGTVRVSNLPASFKGVTRFKYKVTDPSSAYAVGTSAVFVGTNPFRVAFVGDESSDSSPEVFMTDFVATAWRVTGATEGNLRLRGFVASENGATIAYRREDTTAPDTTDLSFVRTLATDTQVRVALPSGYVLQPDADGNDQYAVSPDGQWIAALASTSSPTAKVAVFLLSVSDPAGIRNVSPGTAAYASQPRFSSDSSYLYFLSSDDASGSSGKALYRIALSASSAPALVSAAAGVATDDVSQYTVSPDQTRVTLQANRGGAVGLYFVSLAQPGTETRISQAFGVGESLVSSTVGLAPGFGAPTDNARVAYKVSKVFGLTAEADVAESSSSPNPRTVTGSVGRVIGLRPDGVSLLYSRFTSGSVEQVWEYNLDAANEELIGNGELALYDDSQDTLILRQSITSGATTYPVLAAANRGSSFGAPQQLGTSGKAARFIGLSGAARAVALIGEGPVTGSTPSTVRIALVNARAPDRLLNLASFESPTSLTSSLATVVTY